jgi:hypothetical protein
VEMLARGRYAPSYSSSPTKSNMHAIEHAQREIVFSYGTRGIASCITFSLEYTSFLAVW